MKLSKLANSYLEYMVKEYAITHNNSFAWEKLKNQFPKEDDEFICDAFRLLAHDGLVKNHWASNLPYLVFLELSSVRDAEQNTAMHKTYNFLKELRDWI